MTKQQIENLILKMDYLIPLCQAIVINQCNMIEVLQKKEKRDFLGFDSLSIDDIKKKLISLKKEINQHNFMEM